MSESEHLKPVASQFVVPDLELEPNTLVSRAQRAPLGSSTIAGPGPPGILDEDPFQESAAHLELDHDSGAGGPRLLDFGASIELGGAAGFALASSTAPFHHADVEAVGRHLNDAARPLPNVNNGSVAAWPSSRRPDAATLSIDPLATAELGGYGAAPRNLLLTPLYAWRVFARQAELKARLVILEAEQVRAELERETELAELGRSLRHEAQPIASFGRYLAPLMELERVASQRARALSSVNAELAGHDAALQAELAETDAQVSVQQSLEQEADRTHAARSIRAQRAEAKLKRVQIEIRAVMHVAERKLGPPGAQITKTEAEQLATLRQRAEAAEPEVAQARAELQESAQAVTRVRAQLDMLARARRLNARKKQALTEHYEKDLETRTAGVNESKADERSALAELARALLAANGSVAVSEPWLERIRRVNEGADRALLLAETQRLAISAYDRSSVRQGVRLACTVLASCLLLLVLKLAL